MVPFHINQAALAICDQVQAKSPSLGVELHTRADGGRTLDFGVQAPGGLEAGLLLARICTANLADISLVPGPAHVWPGPWVAVRTDQPVWACMAGQYAGWPIQHDKYFAMGSGPFRAARGKEPVLSQLSLSDASDQVVGVLETSTLPDADVCEIIAQACGVPAGRVTLAAARTKSLAGSTQIVARSVETALHKLHELGFDLSRVQAAWGMAPIPPSAKSDTAAIGLTNDAILYAGEVTLWVSGPESDLVELGPLVPSRASHDYGRPFAEIFAAYDYDFYKVDKALFSPAAISFYHMASGKTYRFGQAAPDILARSFGLVGTF